MAIKITQGKVKVNISKKSTAMGNILIDKIKNFFDKKKVVAVIVTIVLIVIILIIFTISTTNRSQENNDTVVTGSLMWVKDPINNPGESFKQKTTWQSAKELCENLDFAGRKDWRLPTVQELSSVVDYSSTSPAISKSVFPGTSPSPYWTSTEYNGNDSIGWAVHFSAGLVFDSSKQDKAYVRCVRNK